MLRQVATEIWCGQVMDTREALEFKNSLPFLKHWIVAETEPATKRIHDIHLDIQVQPIETKRCFAAFNRARIYLTDFYRRFATDGNNTRYGRPVEMIRAIHYESGARFNCHTDLGGRARQHMSAILYLNDIDYGGGETHFPRQDFEHKGKPGEMVVFPSMFTHPHEGRPVTTGEKLIVFCRLDLDWSDGSTLTSY